MQSSEGSPTSPYLFVAGCPVSHELDEQETSQGPRSEIDFIIRENSVLSFLGSLRDTEGHNSERGGKLVNIVVRGLD